MKFEDRKQQRLVNDQMADLLLGIKRHANAVVQDCIDITLRILQETDIEEKEEQGIIQNECEPENDLTTNQCIKGLYAIKVVLKSAMGKNYPEQTKNQLTCLDRVINELNNCEGLTNANNQLKKQIEMLKLDRDCDGPKTVTTKQLEDLYGKFEKKLWHEHEDVMGNQMVEMGTAEQILSDFLMELGCWDED